MNKLTHACLQTIVVFIILMLSLIILLNYFDLIKFISNSTNNNNPS